MSETVDLTPLGAILSRFTAAGRTALLPALQSAQAEFGYLSEPVAAAIGRSVGRAAGRRARRHRFLRLALPGASGADRAAGLHRPILRAARGRCRAGCRLCPSECGCWGDVGRRCVHGGAVTLSGPVQCGRLGQRHPRPAGPGHHLCPCDAGRAGRHLRRPRPHHWQPLLDVRLCRRGPVHRDAPLWARPADPAAGIPGRGRHAGADPGAHPHDPARR